VHEMVPLAAGVVIALLVLRFDAGSRSKAITLLVCSAAIGAVASFVSGELSVSWTFLAIDTALALLAAGVTMVLVASRRRWLTRRQHFEQ
jgi:hypothetical protein